MNRGLLIRYFIHAVIIMGTLLGTLLLGAVAATGQAAYEKYTLMLESDYLQLYVNETTAEFAVVDRATGYSWYSNPPARNQEERIARGAARDALGAHLNISYFTPGDRKSPADRRRFMDSFNDAVKHEQALIRADGQRVRIDYRLGRQWLPTDYLHIIVSQTTFEQDILPNITDRFDRGLFERHYVQISLAPVEEDYSRMTILRLDKEQVFGDYTLVSTDRIAKRELIQLWVNQITEHNSATPDRAQLRFEHAAPLIEEAAYILRTNIPAWDVEDMIDVLQTIGFTPQRVQAEHEKFQLDPPEENRVVFDMAMELWLDGTDLVVRLPEEALRYPQNIPLEERREADYPLNYIEVLPLFGAAGPADDGYVFIPDGSGALIYTNNGRTQTPALNLPIYGRDVTRAPQRETASRTQPLHLPVYGMKQDDQAFVAIIEAGDAIARIQADVAGRTNSYNRVYPRFEVIPFSTMALSGDYADRAVNVYQSRITQGDLQIRYSFLTGDQADYVGMARRYQQYLVTQTGRSALPAQDDIPFYVNLLGAIDVRRPILGIPRTVIQPLTTFAEAQHIVDALQSRGISNVRVQYSGWLKGGLRHGLPLRPAIESAVGDSKSLAAFQAFLARQNIPLFPAVSLQLVQKDTLFDGFSSRRDAARFLNRGVAQLFRYDLATYQARWRDNVVALSPGTLPGAAQAMLDRLHPWDVAGISFLDLGNVLYSDFRERPEQLIDRQQALRLQQEVLADAAARGIQLLIQGANSYTLPWAQGVTYVPLTSSDYNLADRAVPFLPIVLHGYWEFTSEPINLADDDRVAMLRAAETGAKPYFVWSFQPSSVVKDTDFDYLNSVHYGDWLDEATAFYHVLNDLHREVQHVPIVAHGQAAPGLMETVFANGTRVLVNYNRQSVDFNGLHIPAESFIKARREP